MLKIGIVGGGQLAQMMAVAAQELGIAVIVQTPHATDPAVNSAIAAIFAEVDDVAATKLLAAKCDVITFENEFVNLAALEQISATGVCFRPAVATLTPLLDKYTQRCYLRELGLPVPQFDVLTQAALPPGFSFPVVVKARRNGYDGQGTFIIKDHDALDRHYNRYPDTPFLVEEFVKFDRELAIIAARGVTGEIVTYPLLETQQEDRVCRRVFTLEAVSPELVGVCESIADRLLSSLDAIGVLAIELFATPDGKVLVNEIAPRTHNSGHLTIEACTTSQFSQIMRAVAGLPLGSTALTCGSAAMVNLLGYEDSDSDYAAKREQIAALSDTYVHWYGKTAARIGRKLGHVTIVLDRSDRQRLQRLANQVEQIWYGVIPQPQGG